MTRSIFDPTGGETERSGSRNLGPDAANNSHMPPDIVDGDISQEEISEARADGKVVDDDLGDATTSPAPGV